MTAALAAAWLIVMTSASPGHLSIDGFRYGSMRECLDALGRAQIGIRGNSGPTAARLVAPLKCTNERPTWWRE
jgi:hypothetical protein